MIEELYSGFGYRIVMEEATLPDGRVKKVPRVHRFDSAHIIALPTPNTVLVLREYRPFYRSWIWMIPSGHVDKEHDALEAAQRELREETGYRAQEMVPYGTAQHSEMIVVTNHFFIGRDLVRDPLEQDPDEMIEVHEMPINEALENILSSKKVHTPSAFGLLRYLREH